MSKLGLLVGLVGLAAAACTPLDATSSHPTSPPPSTSAAGSAGSPSQAPAGTPFAFRNIRLVIPPALGSGAEVEVVPRSDGENVAFWERLPEHVKITLTYAVAGGAHEHQILVLPADEFAAMGHTDGLDLLQAVLTDPGVQPAADELPRASILHGRQTVAARAEVVEFETGAGVRFLTQYDPEALPVNNSGLFYHFQGLTSDGRYRVLAVLPLTGSMLADDWESPIPARGVPWPGIEDPDAVRDYYAKVTDKLDDAAPDAFTPGLESLDALIRSLKIID